MTVNTMPNWLAVSRSLATSPTLWTVKWKDAIDPKGGWHLHRCWGWPGKSKVIHVQWPSRLSMSLGCHSHRQVGPCIHLLPPSFSSAWQRVTKVSQTSPTPAPRWSSSNARVGHKRPGVHRAGLYTHPIFPVNQWKAGKHWCNFKSSQILKAMGRKTRHLCRIARGVTYHLLTDLCHILHTRACVDIDLYPNSSNSLSVLLQQTILRPRLRLRCYWGPIYLCTLGSAGGFNTTFPRSYINKKASLADGLPCQPRKCLVMSCQLFWGAYLSLGSITEMLNKPTSSVGFSSRFSVVVVPLSCPASQIVNTVRTF